jgi:putative peptide zinc metalloprotease protein
VSGNFFSDTWYRVAALRPSLRSHGQVHRHRYRGQAWYVLQDHASGRSHRFTPAAYRAIGLMDGSRSVDAIWQRCVDELGDAAPTQDELIQLLSQLHAADLLQADVSPDAHELFERAAKRRNPVLRANLRNPLAIRIPLWDPDRFLLRTLPYVAPLFGRFGALLWLAAVLPAALLAWMHWDALAGSLPERVLSGQSLLVLWLVFPLVKLLHELGHAYATRVDGGEVHEMGIMLLVLAPIPYVDSSSANAFRSKWRRALVGSAGMLVELFLAALALYVWLLAEPGWVRTAAFNVMLVAGVSTVVFNGNPLLRFDGYYILADVVEIPNLGNRSSRYWAYLIHRYAFGRGDDERFDAAPGERRWLFAYGPLSLAYRLFVTFGIALFLATEYLLLGVLLAAWGVFQSIVVPVAKMLHHLVTNPRLIHRRGRAYAVSAAAVAVAAALLFAVPAPLRTQTEGVVWLPENALVRAGAPGFAVRTLVPPGTAVQPGEPLVESELPDVFAELAASEAELRGLQARYASEMREERVRADMTLQRIAAVQARLDRVAERADGLVARAADSGVFVVPQPADLPGRFFRKGETIGYVVRPDNRIVRVLVSQDDIGLVRAGVERVEVRVADRLGETYAARVLREVPGGLDELPSRVLGAEGGGQVPADPRDAQGTRALQRWFQLDLELPEAASDLPLGSRVYVRFSHDWEPVGAQLWRRTRQLFLARLSV